MKSDFKDINVEENDVPYAQEYVSLLVKQTKIDAYEAVKNFLTSKEAILNYMHKRKRKRQFYCLVYKFFIA